ncbi:hypothetical protein CXF96_12940 [Stenotrophomonas sp. Betaine-02u-21]|uniref:hypothetical protein n=1 Tax=unclassified Stenotrophomonas TaxID=196198 RepID=UPI000C3268DA|nr:MULTISPECIES: hypothetical protein [unclassified Stenotrophomonas]PKH73118.1 hypothetical protein CXF96_12940 [Stenotrophomonas sp. Betaine-02u-21]PKH76611.1 hypothetical protein CXF90_00465 [Stenotrophomonas sp. Betaine-02u-23]PKH96009.1 hypothetical protein CXG43_09630 [Stenotrophomonas sp. Bg11-02]
MSFLSPSRCLALALVAALSTTACAQRPSFDTAEKDAVLTEDPAESRNVDGYTYTTKPVAAKIGPHRFAFPANYYDDQIGPAIGGGVGLTLMWPDLDAAPPGTRSTRSMSDHHRAISMSIDHVDAVPIGNLLQRITSTESKTEDGSIERQDPRNRLDMRRPSPEQFGLTPYVIDEERMAAYSKNYLDQRGSPPVRNVRTEDDWYIARSSDDTLSTFIKCDQPHNGRQGLEIKGAALVSDGADIVASCSHYLVDQADSLSVTLFYPSVLLKDWKSIEDAALNVLSRYKVH